MNSVKKQSRLTSVLVFIAILMLATSAFALDKNQIIQMGKLGLNDKAIMGAIDSAGDELSLTEEDLGELRLQGISDAVIEHLKITGHVKGLDTAPADGAPADGDVEPAPAPSTEETEEEKAERLAAEKAREEEILKKAQELNQEKAQEDARQKRLEQMARRLPEAAELVEAGDNMEAALIYLEFLSLQPEEQGESWYEAKFGLAKASFQEGILSGASSPLLEVLLAGADRPHFVEGFRMLRKLTQEIGYRPPVLEELTKLYTGDLNAEFLAEFNYYMGKFFFDYNRSDLAIEYLQKVPNTAPDYPEALYVMGVAKLDPTVNDTAGALYNFRDAIIAGEAEPGGNEEILQLGYLALARTWYEVGLYDVALFYYLKVPSDSSRNAESVFEQAWSYFMKNDTKRALGILHTLHSPLYEKWYFPDLFILEAATYLNLCKFDQSQVALGEFTKRYLDKQPRLSEYLANTTEPKDYWTYMMTSSGKSDSELNGPPRIFVNAVLNDLEFYNIYRVVQNLQKERAALEANVGALGDFGNVVLERVNEQLETKIEEGGILVQQKFSDLDKELTDWDLKATQISFEIDSESKRQLETQLVNPNAAPKKAASGTTITVVAADWQSWDFDGEYWVDEVPNYRSSLRTECVEQ